MQQPLTAEPGRGFRRWGIGVSITGAALLILSLVLGITLAVSGFGSINRSDAQVSAIDGSGTIELGADVNQSLYREQGTSSPDCRVEAPDGGRVAEGRPAFAPVETHGHTWEAFDSFRTTTAGEYRIDCGDAQVLVGTGSSWGVFGDVAGIFSGVGGIFVIIFGGGLGASVLIIGLVLYFVGRSKRNRARFYRHYGGGYQGF